MSKARNDLIDHDFLYRRASNAIAKGYPKAKWVVFCEAMLKRGVTLTLYEAKHTFSKYITVHNGPKQFKVRFSNHKPIYEREAKGDCDFFVGHSNFGITNTNDALRAVRAWLDQNKAVVE